MSRRRKASTPVLLRNKTYGSVYRIIRTTIGYTSEKGRIKHGPDLFWIVKGRNADGTWHRGTSWISVDVWATGDWEVLDEELQP